jgi:hypothetical protein
MVMSFEIVYWLFFAGLAIYILVYWIRQYRRSNVILAPTYYYQIPFKNYFKIQVSLDGAAILERTLESVIPPTPSNGTYSNLGKVLGDEEKYVTQVRKVCRFQLRINNKTQRLNYKSSLLDIDKVSLSFLLANQKMADAYINNDNPTQIDVDLSFLPQHVLTGRN